ncbi:MAG TPA: HD domain-containing phosphohydrolase [Pyrinomonadaceae bacterium]|jgi:HD-GYP domain-containing protein (c-di-GMP phosphodiesterase class II)|nr:HD domain-containing phosphohydrolase [Pyrinomonadaceae bacterium]
MHDELSLEILGAPTVRLVNTANWASRLQPVCARLKAVGRGHGAGGTHYLTRRLRQTRPSTYEHCLRASRIARVIGRALGFDKPRLQQLSATAMMHDIGKLLVPEQILMRPRKPTRLEQFILKMHPNFGALIASYFNLAPELRIRTQHHHERWDGKGYPHKLGGEDIPLMARIVQVADTYDAMVAADRTYRCPLTHAEATAELREHSRRQFDPRVVEAFLDTFPETR